MHQNRREKGGGGEGGRKNDKDEGCKRKGRRGYKEKEGKGKRKRREQEENSVNILHDKRDMCTTGNSMHSILSLYGRDSPMSEEKPHSCKHDLSRGRCLVATCSVKLVR